ncbi:MAG: hypothetical protein E3K32_12985 [wastewater metagenome]|nr:hypothetical protein [Candidatus Loosdrechtia aerotolerans]
MEFILGKEMIASAKEFLPSFHTGYYQYFNYLRQDAERPGAHSNAERWNEIIREKHVGKDKFARGRKRDGFPLIKEKSTRTYGQVLRIML